MNKFILILLLSIFVFAQSKPLNVLYISHSKKDQPFVKLVNIFSKAVAKDLNINLRIVFPPDKITSSYGDLNRYTYEDFAKPYFFSKNRPDVIIAILFRKRGKMILEFSRESGIPVFIVNTNIPVDDKIDIKEPRSLYKNFLGLVAADEAQAGELLIKSLLKKVNNHKTDENIEVIGINGPRSAYEAIQRVNGLKRGISNQNNVTLHQVVYANWDTEVAYKQTLRLLDRYPNLDVIWTASDSMAIGAKKAIKEKKRDIVAGGIDWSENGLKYVENGSLDATVGGHFMNGGISLILLYDYFHGKDFKKELGLEINFNMFALTSKNIKKYREEFAPNQWDKIDFKKYSKVLNPSLEKYDFSLGNFINSIGPVKYK